MKWDRPFAEFSGPQLDELERLVNGFHSWDCQGECHSPFLDGLRSERQYRVRLEEIVHKAIMALTDADLTMLSDRGVWSNAAPHFADAGLEMIRAEREKRAGCQKILNQVP
jgi:hypothetical protein